ncbi:MAG TPA: hypothetical protein DEH00_03425, partial [Candidatus Marinimicrobia bacterium]|nr:hypothetical protein [Candidatus Neomarinimicrobiota bacterium]
GCFHTSPPFCFMTVSGVFSREAMRYPFINVVKHHFYNAKKTHSYLDCQTQNQVYFHKFLKVNVAWNDNT